MTERQVERLRDKIKQIKRALAAEKRKFGGYDDSRGMRYIPPQYYLKLQDFKGAKRYFNWFHKNFPDDAGFPQFLFEWAITLFYSKQKKQAGHMLIRAFDANPFLVDQFLGNELHPPYQTYQTAWQYRCLFRADQRTDCHRTAVEGGKSRPGKKQIGEKNVRGLV